jgi:hypothetical protein
VAIVVVSTYRDASRSICLHLSELCNRIALCTIVTIIASKTIVLAIRTISTIKTCYTLSRAKLAGYAWILAGKSDWIFASIIIKTVNRSHLKVVGLSYLL